MYIAPNSTIRLLSGVPIDKNQSDTLWFSNVSNQTNYFIGKTIAVFTQQTYQRVQRGYCRLEVSAETIYGCNYMMFQNTSFGSKWFYAFVNNVEYINNEVSEVRFTIDPIQTWFFEYTLNQCYIERCTPTTDEIGDNILPEPVQTGEYVLNNGLYSIISPDLRDLAIICLICDPNHTSGYYGGGIYNGVASGGQLYFFDGTASGLALFNQLVIESQVVRQAPDALLSVYMCPKALVQVSADSPLWTSASLSDHLIAPNVATWEHWVTLPAITKATSLNGYTPRNAKCYTYPYTFYRVDNGQSDDLLIRYEFCDSKQPALHITGNITYPVEITAFPYRYKNSGNILAEYRAEKIAIKGYPQCSWSMDAWAAWLAQNSLPIALDVATAALPIVVAGMTGTLGGAGELGAMETAGNIIGQSSGTLNTIKNIAKEAYSASIASDITKGSIQTGSNDVASRRLTFKGGTMTMPDDYLRAADQFFDAFGYTCHQWGDVNIHARTRWTYVKTVGANVDGNVPADDAQYIASCYDSGIRFWADTANACNYSSDNGFLT